MAKTSSPFIRGLEKAIIDHYILVLIAGVALTVFFGYYIRDVRFSSSSDEFFIKGDPDKEYYEKVAKRNFGNDQVVVVAMVAPEGETIYTPERLAKLGRITRALNQVEVEAKREVKKENGETVWEKERVRAVKAVSLTNIPTIRAPRDPETGGYQKAIEVPPLIPRIPSTAAEMAALREEINHNPLYKKNLVSEDGRATAVVAFISDFETQTYLYDRIMMQIKEIIKKEEKPEIICVAGVPETRVEMVKRMMRDLKVLLPLSFVLVLVTLIFNFRNFRGVIFTLIGLLTTTIWALGFMGMAHIPINMVTLILPPLLLALGSSYSIYIMSGYLAEAQPERSVKEIVRTTLETQILPIVVCAVTNMLGFSSLMLNRIPAIQELGFASTVGIFFGMVVAIFILPAVLMLMPKPKFVPEGERKQGVMDRFLDGLPRLIIRHRPAIFSTAIALILLCIYGITRIKIDTDFLHFFSADDPVIQAVETQTKYLAGAAPFNIVLEADRSEAFKHPAMLKKMEELQRWAEKEIPGIDTTLSMADYIKLLNQAFHQNDPSYYKIPDTPEETSQLLMLYDFSGSPQDFDPYRTRDYQMVNILIRSRLVGSTETNRAIRRIEEKAKELFVPVRVRRHEPIAVSSPPIQAMAPIREAAEKAPTGEETGKPAGPVPSPPRGATAAEEGKEEEINWGDPPPADPPAGAKEEEIKWEDSAPAAPPPPTGAEPPAGAPPEGEEFVWPSVMVHMTGTIYLMNKSADAVSSGQVSGFSSALGTIFLAMSLLFLSFKIGFLSILPNLFPIFLLFGIMGFSGITLNFSTSLIASISLGMGVEDTIHYIHHNNHELQKTRDQNEAMIRTLRDMGIPMIYTSVALFFGFAILAASDFVPIRQFGILTGSTLLLAITSNIIILPAIMITVRIITLWDLLDMEIGDNPSRYIKIFHGLTNHQAKVAVLMGHTAEFQDGEYIIREDEMGNEMFVVLKGYVNIIKGEGENQVTLATIQPGDAFGEMALLRHTTRSASARAEGRVKLFVLDEQILHRLQKRYPRISSQIFYNITQILSDRLQAASAQVLECTVDLREMGKEKNKLNSRQ